jgi:hypothetical protein
MMSRTERTERQQLAAEARHLKGEIRKARKLESLRRRNDRLRCTLNNLKSGKSAPAKFGPAFIDE